MKCNLGPIEKYVRLVLGLMLVALGFFLRDNYSNTVGITVMWVGVSFLVSAALSWCPIKWLGERIRS